MINWENKKVIVTGANGFIGSHLVESLLEKGAEVTAVVRRVSRTQITHDFTNLAKVKNHPLLKIVPLDLAGASALLVLAKLEGEYWFHMAADAYVPASFTQPSSVVMNNIASTTNVLETINMLKPKNAIIISSSEVYGSSQEPISEKHPLNPTTPYAASKVACDRLAWAYKETFNTSLTIVRPFNTYGPRHVYDVVPIFIRAALRGEPLKINGDGLQTRDLTYVSDMVSALMTLGGLPGNGKVYNVGTGIDQAVITIAEVVKEVTNSQSEIQYLSPRKGEVRKLQSDISKIIRETDWRPAVSFVEGIRKNVEWEMQKVTTC
ncbi:hypothetical protein COD67_07650 [Bacillus cereus]|nr:hypothetical protein COI89_08715 [Bacillus cereus]PGU68131.1 hypothetical protein COD67_07650 [Bacillus cereus]